MGEQYTIVQCSRCLERVMVTCDVDSEPVLPDGWSSTEVLDYVGKSIVFICPTCINEHKRASKVAARIRKNLGGKS